MMLGFRSIVLSVAPIFLRTSSQRSPLSVTPLTMSASTEQCNGKSAVIFLHGLGDTPAGWSSLQHNLPSIRPKLGMDVHYVFPPAPTIAITINGGMQMPGWFDLYDWPIGVNARDDRQGKIAAVEQLEKVRNEYFISNLHIYLMMKMHIIKIDYQSTIYSYVIL